MADEVMNNYRNRDLLNRRVLHGVLAAEEIPHMYRYTLRKAAGPLDHGCHVCYVPVDQDDGVVSLSPTNVTT